MKKLHFDSPFSLLITTIVIATVPYLIVGLFESGFYRVIDISSYLVFHNVAEFFSVMVSFSIFGLGWYAYDQNNDRHSLFLSIAFFGIGLMDFMHTLGYAGMPDLITPNVTNKATLFWLAVRLFSSLVFLASAFIPPSCSSRWLSKIPLLTITLFISGAVFVTVIFLPEYIPAAFIPGSGLTPFKKNTEYIIIFLLFFASVMYWKRLTRTNDKLIHYFLVAFVICIFSEMSFTLYKSAFDTYNMLGHIYKILAFMLVYKGIFVASVRRPYEDLQQNRNMLYHIINNIPQSLFWKDRNSVYLGCNRVFAQQAGIDNPDNIVGMSDFDLPWGKEFADGYRADDHQIISNAEAKYHIIESLRKSDDTVIWIDTTKVPLTDSAGMVNGLLGVYEDITWRKRAEEELKEALLFNQQIIDCVQEGIIVYDLGLRYQVWNPYMERITGVKSADVLGKTPMEIFPFLKDSGVIDRLELILQGSITNAVELPFDIPSSGKSGWVADTSAPLLNAKGKIIGIIGTVRDTTESRRTADQLQQAQKMESVGRLAGGVAHDFNNMLSVILGNAELGLMHLDEDHPVTGNLKEIRNTSERSADLTRQLLAFARKQTVVPKVIDLNETVSKMLKMLQRLIGEDIHLTLQAASDLWPVKIDPSQIDQILANLCVNARDAIKSTGRIIIETENRYIDAAYCSSDANAKPGEYVRITVSDDGDGMDKETLTHIFEPFYTTKELGKGTGLGLATVYGAVKQNNGFITVYSELKRGTAITIHLPRYECNDTASGIKEAEIESVPTGSGTILLVEDESAILAVAEMMLKKIGYKVLSADTPEKAVRLAQEYSGNVDLLITDVIMPVLNGKEVAKSIQQLFPNIKSIFMSGYTSDVITSQGILAEGACFIQKPFTMMTLATKVKEVLNQ